MKLRYGRWCLPAFLVILALVLLSLGSCVVPQQSTFYDAGAQDATISGTDLVQHWLFRFDTAASSRTLTTPSAKDIISVLTSPSAGQVIVFAVTADGSHEVSINGGTDVTIKSSASRIGANTTLTLYCTLDSVKSGSEAVTIY